MATNLDPPTWFTSLRQIGYCMAEQPNREDGEEYPVVVLSVPTGQFVVWALFDGSVAASPKIHRVPISEPLLCTTWSDEQKQISHLLKY